jgi:hypothetical protein
VRAFVAVTDKDWYELSGVAASLDESTSGSLAGTDGSGR